MVIDSATMTAAGEALGALKAIIEKFGKGKPDASSALSLVSQLQQHIDQLRARNLELETHLLDLKKENFELRKTIERQEEWASRTKDLELFQTPGPARVYARHSHPPYFCVTCFEDRKLIPLQPRGSVADCPRCKFIYEIDHPIPLVFPDEPPTRPTHPFRA